MLWHSNLQTAFGDGIETIFEFGGGIGKATEPDGKRPNLEGMIKKSLRGSDKEVLYHAVINSSSIKNAVDVFNGSE